MNRLFLTVLLTFSLAATALGDMTADIRAVLNDKLLARCEVGVRVVRLGDVPSETRLIFEHNATTPLIPASNMKLVTTAAALEGLGADFKFRTLLVGKGRELAIVGDGDPTLGDAELLKKVGWDTLTVFNGWARQLAGRKITSAGNLLVDDSIFEPVFQHPNWPANQADRRYMAGVAGVNLNANCVDVTITSNGFNQLVGYEVNPPTGYVSIRNSCVHGDQNAIVLSRVPGANQIILAGESRGSTAAPVSVNVEDPALFAGTVLSETLAAGGVTIGGSVTRDRTIRQQLAQSGGGGWTVLAVHETALPMVLARANKDSENVYAESLAKRLGAHAVGGAGIAGTGDWKNAAASLSGYMKRIGVPENQFSFDDGCGLSKQNAITTAALTQVLIANYHHPNRQTFFSSLAVAGIDGTLDDRFRGSDLRGRVFGKSGFVEGVSALSGYFKARDNQWYAFSILMNGIGPRSNSSIKPLQEKIIIAVDKNVGR